MIFWRRSKRHLSAHIVIQAFQVLPWIGLLVFLLQSPAIARQPPSPAHVALRFGILPDSARDIIDARYAPLLHYIKQETGISIELLVPENYQELLTLFREKKLDLAFFGGYTFIQAQQQANAKPLVMRDIDLHFSSVFLVRTDNRKNKLQEFKGGILAFGPKLSTSGHLMPRYFLNERGINPETFFAEVRHSAGHDQTAYWVRDGKVDLGAANSVVIRKMFRDGILVSKDVRILWETPYYTDYVLAVQPDLDETVQQRLLDSLLALSPLHRQQKRILDNLGAGGFLPASNADFDSLRKIITHLQHKTP